MRIKALAVATMALAIYAGSEPMAMAAPACDPTTSDGYLACYGGGPWQNQDGSSPDTYGATGEKGFLYDNRSVGAFPNMSDSRLLAIGHAICGGLANGKSEQAVERVLIKDGGMSELNAGALVISAQMYLC